MHDSQYFLSSVAIPHSLHAESQRIRKICPRFRILIIGRANAGRTTILQKVSNTAERPTVRDPEGQKIDLSFLIPSRMRGKHDIEEMVFPNNPGFSIDMRLFFYEIA